MAAAPAPVDVAPAAKQTTPSLLIPQSLHDRLSLPLAHRLFVGDTVGAACGFLIGAAKGAQDSGFRFRAENAHRLPSTQAGWFLYHKSKNYNMMFGGIIDGLKQSLRFTVWVSAFFVLEAGVDRGRAASMRIWRDRTTAAEDETGSTQDFASSMLAGMGTAGLFSAWNRFALPTAARTAKMGAKWGLAFGVLQDALSLVKGRRLWYVERVKRVAFGEGETAQTLATT